MPTINLIPASIRHGHILPESGTPRRRCGGPTDCAICNAEMVELEGVAIRLAVRNFYRWPDRGAALDERWMSRGFPRKLWRDRAAAWIRQRNGE